MAISLYKPGDTHARSLIDAGKVDETSDWSFSADDENALLGDPPNWDTYAAWHLGHDAGADAKTKAAWSYPFGKDGKVYRSALRAIRTRASQQNETDIFDAAGELLKALDAKSTANVLQFRPRTPKRVVASASSWYRFIVAQAADGAEPDSADLQIFNEIGPDPYNEGDTTPATQFIADLNALPASVKNIRLHVNSPGGSAFDAIAIANALRQHPATVTASIEGLAASAATIVTNGGADAIQIADNALVMIHDPAALAFGTSADLRQMADRLDVVRDAIITTYQRHSPLDRTQLADMMGATTWMDADQAVANGFATEKVDGLRAAALLEPAAIASLAVPDRYRERIAAFAKAPATAPTAAAPADVIAAVAAAGLETTVAGELVAAQLPMAEVTARITAKREARDRAQARETEITALCSAAKLPELAAGYIAASFTAADVRAHLTTITAKLDQVAIDANLDPDAGKPKPPAISVAAVYAERNCLKKE